MNSELSPSSGNAVSEAVIDQLARTKGWTRFFSVMLWIGAAFLILGAIFTIVIGVMGAVAAGGAMENSPLAAAVGGGAMGVVIGIFYLVIAVIYIYPALKLGNFSSRVQDLIDSRAEMNLVAALDEQRAFWKYIGIWMIIFLSIYAAIILVAIVAVVTGAASTFQLQELGN